MAPIKSIRPCVRDPPDVSQDHDECKNDAGFGASVKFDSEGPASEVQEVREHARETAVFVTIPAGTRPSVRTIDAIDSTATSVIL